MDSGKLYAVCCLHRILVLTGLLTTAARGGVLEDVGFSALKGRSQIPLVMGGGVPVGQVEVFAPGTTAYSPDTLAPGLAGKTFTLRSGATTVSGHASMVASSFYGNGTSPGEGVSSIALFSATSFVDDVLRTGSAGRAPGGAGVSVINNSWVAGFTDNARNIDAVRRLDDLISRDNVLVFSGVENEQDGSFPKLLASSYNGVAVGTLNGSRGPVVFDGVSRIKPDLVVNTGQTSVASALAAGAGALLRSRANADAQPAGQLAIKAILMTGAQRDSTWHRGRLSGADNTTAPLDFQQGAGLLRVDRSYDILEAGRSTAGASIDPSGGWDQARPARGATTISYAMRVEETLASWSAFLTWNRVVRGMNGDAYDSTPTLADMSLALYRVRKGGPRLVALSDSAGDNVESLQLIDLPAGSYRLTLTTDQRNFYGLAWASESAGGAAILKALGEQGSVSNEGGFGALVPEPPLIMLALPLVAWFSFRRPVRQGIHS